MNEPNRIVICPVCEGKGCEDCYNGKVRIPSKKERDSQNTIFSSHQKEIAELRKISPLHLQVPCGICGKSILDHCFVDVDKVGRLCPLK